MIQYEREGPLAFITLANPEKMNRLSVEAMSVLADRLDEADRDPEVRAVIVTGAGEKAFCAGADLGEFRPDAGIVFNRKQNEAYKRLCLTMHGMRTPVVARVNGAAVAGGMVLVALAHLAVASESARFGTPEIKAGAFPNMVMAAILRSIPRKAALKMILLGDLIDAPDALAIGLVNEVVPIGELDAAARRLAEQLADKSPAVMGMGLDSLRISSDLPYPQALDYLQEMAAIIRTTEDCQEGARAFMEKRQPVWTGK